jgi:hypothetical protein
VDSVEVPRTRGGLVQLPASGGGTVPARIRTAPLQFHPDLVVDGVRQPTGPRTAPWLRVLAVLPLLGLFGGLLGGVVGIAGVLINFCLLQRGRGAGATAAAILGVTVACAAVWFLGATLLVATVPQ